MQLWIFSNIELNSFDSLLFVQFSAFSTPTTTSMILFTVCVL